MPEFREDVLQAIPEDEIEKLYQILMREWPSSGYQCGFFKTCYDWRKKDPSYDVSFFYKKDNIESGIFVGILNSGHRTFALVVYAVEGYEIELENILMKTKKIDWGKLPMLQGVLSRHTKLMEDVVRRKGLSTSLYVDTALHLIHPELVMNYDVRYPDDVYVARLTTDNVDVIYDLWPLKNIHTNGDIISSIEYSFSYGVFSKHDNELLAWVMQSHYGAIGMLYTKENIRRHGYAKILIMMMAKKMVKEGIPAYAMITETNLKSIALFQSMEFKHITSMKYLKVNQK